MKYIAGAVVAILAMLFIRNLTIKSPEGMYSSSNGAILMNFEKSGRLSIGALAGSSIDINNRRLEGPAANQVTVTTWKRVGTKIYITIPGEKQPIPGLTISGEDLMMDNIRLRRIQ